MIFSTKKAQTAQKGSDAEQKACDFLCDKGLTLEYKNYSSRQGEVDLIMKDQDSIVFVEVRYRQSNAFGGAAASVVPSKQKRIIATAKHYLVTKNLFEKCPVRFDIIAIQANDIQWIKGAF